MKTTRICGTCGKEFVSEHGIKYCSDNCRQTAIKLSWDKSNKAKNGKKHRVPLEKSCPVCGNLFVSYKNRSYCSDECREKSSKIITKNYQKRYHIEVTKQKKKAM